jgi:hypothetical protein
MIRRTSVSPFALAITSIAIAAQTLAAQAPAGKACGLVTASELQSVLDGNVNLKDGSIGQVQMCSGEGQNGKVMLRLFKRAGPASGDAEKAGIDAVKKMGAQVDVKTAGGITCMTTVPPANLAQLGFGTTCTVTSKAPMFAVIEITAKTQKDMVSIEKLRTVAEKMATRF